MMYWQQWCAIIEEGITNRMNIHEALEVKRSGGSYAELEFTYVSHQQSVEEKLNGLIVPERLKAFHDTVIQAGYRQMDFYKDWASAKIADTQYPLNRSNVHLKACDQSLWDAYHQFQALYPARSTEFNDAIERRLAWFDIV